MYQARDQLLEMIQLWEQAEDIIAELRIESEAAFSRCNDLTDERDDKGYRLLEAEETIQELRDEIQRLKKLNQRKYLYRHSQKRLRTGSHVLPAKNSVGRTA